MANTEPITTRMIDDTAAEVTIPGLGTVVVMRAANDDGSTGLRILTELPEGTTVEVGEA